jgi:hypothetical protein
MAKNRKTTFKHPHELCNLDIRRFITKVRSIDENNARNVINEHEYKMNEGCFIE